MGPTAQTAAVEILVKRAHTPTLVKLIEGFSTYEPHLRSLLTGQTGMLRSALRATLRSTASTATNGAIDLITHSRSGELADLLVDALFGSCPESARRAGEGLHTLGEHYLDYRAGRGLANRPDDPSLRGFDEFLESLGRAATGWERHANARVLETFLWFDAAAAPVVARKLKEPNTTITKTIEPLLGAQASPRLAGFTLRALGMSALRDAAAKGIRSTSDLSYRRAILARASLAAAPEIRRGCRHVGLAQNWLEDIAAFDNLSAKAAHSIVDLITSFCRREVQETSLARQMVDCHQPSISRAALSFLCRTANQHSTEALQSLAARENSAISAKAANEIRRRIGTYSQSQPHSALLAATEDALAPRRAFEQYWREYDRLDGVELEKLARSMRPLADHLLPALRSKLADSQPFLKVRALRTATWLGVTGQIVEQVYEACVHPSPVTRSFAVRMLGRLPGATSTRILRRAIDDPDERVQANAIEAIDELKLDERNQLVLPKLRSEDRRVRGTAVRSLLTVGHREAADALIEMLECGGTARKKTALWIVESLGLVAACGRVRHLREGSSDPRILKTATAVIDGLLRKKQAVEPGPRALADADPLGVHS